MDDPKVLERIPYNPGIFGGKPIIRGKRVAVEHVLGMLAAGQTHENMVEDFPWLEVEDVQACLLHAARMVGWERWEVAGAREPIEDRNALTILIDSTRLSALF